MPGWDANYGGSELEQQIFYWTGCIIWWGLCLLAISGIITAVIISPILIYKNIKKYFNRWKWAAVAASTGLTADDIAYCIYVKTPNDVSPDEMIAWFEKVKERGQYYKKEVEQPNQSG